MKSNTRVESRGHASDSVLRFFSGSRSAPRVSSRSTLDRSRPSGLLDLLGPSLFSVILHFRLCATAYQTTFLPLLLSLVLFGLFLIVILIVFLIVFLFVYSLGNIIIFLSILVEIDKTSGLVSSFGHSFFSYL